MLMNNTRILQVILSITLSLSVFLITAQKTYAADETRYISDILYVPMHSGKTTKHRIIHKGLRTGTALKLLDFDKKAGFSRVKTAGGTEGWIQNQFLSSTPVARTLLAKEKQSNSALRKKLAALSEQTQNISQSHSEFKQQVKTLSSRNQKLTNELTGIKKISSNAINLDSNNRELLKKNEMLKIDIAELQADNARLSDKSDKAWFVRGAFAVMLGALLAVILPRFKPKEKHSEWV